jgi:glycosyltransferase involved in cell wall biosynthesis
VAPRPTVSVIVPFSGSPHQLSVLTQQLSALLLAESDEIIIADNRPGATALALPGGIRLHPAAAVATPGFARNRGAAAAGGEWLVFIDADTEPEPNLLDAYFDPPPADETALLAGGIEDVLDPGSTSLSARHAVARVQMSQTQTLSRPRHPYAQSANLAVRRSALVGAGGFVEHARAGEDADLCFRLVAAGWQIESRPAARVRHSARATLGASLVQLIVHGSGAAWCNRRHPGSFPAPTARDFTRRLGHSVLRMVSAGVRGDGERAGFAGLEILETLAFALGRVIPNRPRWRRRR